VEFYQSAVEGQDHREGVLGDGFGVGVDVEDPDAPAFEFAEGEVVETGEGKKEGLEGAGLLELGASMRAATRASRLGRAARASPSPKKKR